MDCWLESIRDQVGSGTFKPYEAIAWLHIKPTLGSTKLDKLNALHWERSTTRSSRRACQRAEFDTYTDHPQCF
jgi:hypothetical protein